MDYISQLFKLLKNEKILDVFIRSLFDFTSKENYTLSSLRILPCEEGNSLNLIVSNDTNDITKISFSDYKIRYVDENDQFIKADYRGYTDRYLKFMAEHFANYANDCIQDKFLECEKNKQKAISKLENLFSNIKENKTNL